jgi:hypothetical protein
VAERGRGARVWDGAGIAVSGLCVLHCALPPILVGLLPAAAAGIPGDESLHGWLFGGAALTGILAFGPALRRHRRPGPLLAALGAYALLFTGAFLACDRLGCAWEAPLTVSGGLLLIGAHGLNLRACRRACEREAGAGEGE